MTLNYRPARQNSLADAALLYLLWEDNLPSSPTRAKHFCFLMILLCFHHVETLIMNCTWKETIRRYDIVNTCFQKASTIAFDCEIPMGAINLLSKTSYMYRHERSIILSQ